jgi:hypothetical protein
MISPVGASSSTWTVKQFLRNDKDWLRYHTADNEGNSLLEFAVNTIIGSSDERDPGKGDHCIVKRTGMIVVE